MDRAVLLKKIKNKFVSREQKFREYYKKTYSTYMFLKDIADTRYLKPIKGELREYQLVLLKFAKEWFDKFDALDIKYYLIGGNLLGAYRNQGFIPWDDDIDIGMMREDFNKLIAYLKSNFVQMDVSNISYSAKNRSFAVKEHIEKYPDEITFAIFPTHLQIMCGRDMENLKTLDIHPYDFYPNNLSEQDLKKQISEIKKQKNKINNFALINDYLYETRVEVKDSNKIYYGIDNYDFTFLQFTDWYRKEDIFPLKKVKYENIECFIPNNPEKFLTINYGKDYMVMPQKIFLDSHINYRKEVLNFKASLDKQVLLKKLKRRYFTSKVEIYKELYKKFKPCTDMLLDIVDIKTVNHCQDKFLRNEQLKCVEFGQKITDFFNKNNLEYFITSGTLIGAVRHKGFVPWDDDFDVGMMRRDYERLKDILRTNFKEIDISEISISKHNKDSVVDKALKNSNGEIMYFIGPKYTQIYQGKGLANCTLIDVFPHEYYREDYTLEEHKKYMSGIKNKIAEIDSFKDILEFLNNEIRTNPNIVEKSSKIYYGVDSLGSYIVNPTDFYYQDKIFPRKMMKFEDSEFLAPVDADAYIRVQYPDYWSFPKNFSIAPFLKIKLKY